MIADTTVRRTMTLIYFRDVCEIWEGGKVTRTVTPSQADALVNLMEGYTNFFIVDSTPARVDRETFKSLVH